MRCWLTYNTSNTRADTIRWLYQHHAHHSSLLESLDSFNIRAEANTVPKPIELYWHMGAQRALGGQNLGAVHLSALPKAGLQQLSLPIEHTPPLPTHGWQEPEKHLKVCLQQAMGTWGLQRQVHKGWLRCKCYHSPYSMLVTCVSVGL